jgi:hypothetical protein
MLLPIWRLLTFSHGTSTVLHCNGKHANVWAT